MDRDDQLPIPTSVDFEYSTECEQSKGCGQLITGRTPLEFCINFYRHTHKRHPERWDNLLGMTLGELTLYQALLQKLAEVEASKCVTLH